MENQNNINQIQQPNPVASNPSVPSTTATNTAQTQPQNPLSILINAIQSKVDGFKGKKSNPNTPLDVSPSTQNDPGKVDSISHDFQIVKNVAEKVSGAVKEKTSPFIEKGLEETKEALETSKSIVKGQKTKRIIQFLGIGVFFLVLLFIGMQIVNRFINTPNNPINSNMTPTPTITQEISDTPSIYADDPQLRQLEQTIGVLENEARNSSIREPNLNTPALDFTINFK